MLFPLKVRLGFRLGFLSRLRRGSVSDSLRVRFRLGFRLGLRLGFFPFKVRLGFRLGFPPFRFLVSAVVSLRSVEVSVRASVVRTLKQ